MWRLLLSPGQEAHLLWDDVLPRIHSMLTTLRYSEADFHDLAAFALLAHQATELVLNAALRIEADYLGGEVMWSEAAAEASASVAEAMECEGLRTQLFAQTYRMRIAGDLEAIEAEVSAMCATLAEVATREEDLSQQCNQLEQIRARMAAKDVRKSESHDSPLFATLHRELALHGGEPVGLLDAVRGSSLECGLVVDDIDLMRQLMSIADDKTLQGDVQRARRSAEREIEDDEDFLRSIADLDERMQQEAVSRRQLEREDARERLAKEKVLLEALSAAVRHAQSAPPPAVVLSASSKTEADRLDAETARLIAETAMLELEAQQDAIQERLAAQRKLYEQAFKARQRAQARKLSVAAAHATSADTTETSSTFSSASSHTVLSEAPAPSNNLSAEDSRDILALCAQLVSEPCESARRARAAAELTEVCGGKSDAISTAKRTLAGPRAIKALVTMLNMHVKQPELDQFARALCALCAHHPHNKHAVLEAGLMPVLVDRVADGACDNRFLVPLWQSLSAEHSAYDAAVTAYADSLVDHLIAVLEQSYSADEQLLATSALLRIATYDQPSEPHLVRGRDATRALAGVLERKLHDADADECQRARDAKRVATKIVVRLLLQRDSNELFSVPGAAKAVATIADSDRFFASSSSDGANPDHDAAILVVLKELFEFLVSVGRREAHDPDDDTFTYGDDAVRELVSVLSIEKDTQSAWTVKEQCCKALRRLIKVAEDTDKTAAGLPVDANPHHASIAAPRAGLNAAKVVHTTSVVKHLSRHGLLQPLVDILKHAGLATKRVVFAKQEAARLLRSLVEHDRQLVETVISLHAIPALVKLIEVVNKDDPKEAAILALWVLCRDSKPNRLSIVKQPNGIRIVMDLVARTGTNPSDEAAARLLLLIINDDNSHDRAVRAELDVFPDMMRTLEWNVSYGDTVHVKSAAKSLRDRLKQPSSLNTAAKAGVGAKKVKTSFFAPPSQRRRGFSLFFRLSKSKSKK